jgi:hypothetical protein
MASAARRLAVRFDEAVWREAVRGFSREPLGESLLTDQSCAFHRNLEISSRYAWLYKFLPEYFKWAGMAAFASHHARLALFPFRLDTDRTGYVDIPHSLRRQKALLLADVNHDSRNEQRDLRRHLLGARRVRHRGRRDRVRSLADAYYAGVLEGFEAIDQGRRLIEDEPGSADVRQDAQALIWRGNVRLLEHEQRALVQPNLDRLSCAFARLFSIGSALSLEVRGMRDEASYFTSFYLYSPTSLRRIFDEARDHAENPCVLPRSPAAV